MGSSITLSPRDIPGSGSLMGESFIEGQLYASQMDLDMLMKSQRELLETQREILALEEEIRKARMT
jgi:hypothetical protein